MKLYQYDELRKLNQALDSFKRNDIPVISVESLIVDDKVTHFALTDPAFEPRPKKEKKPVVKEEPKKPEEKPVKVEPVKVEPKVAKPVEEKKKEEKPQEK